MNTQQMLRAAKILQKSQESGEEKLEFLVRTHELMARSHGESDSIRITLARDAIDALAIISDALDDQDRELQQEMPVSIQIPGINVRPEAYPKDSAFKSRPDIIEASRDSPEATNYAEESNVFVSLDGKINFILFNTVIDGVKAGEISTTMDLDNLIRKLNDLAVSEPTASFHP